MRPSGSLKPSIFCRRGKVSADMARRAATSTSQSKWPELHTMAPSFMFSNAGPSTTLQLPVTVTHTSAKRAASAAGITS